MRRAVGPIGTERPFGLVAALVVGNTVLYGVNDYQKTHPCCREREFLRGTHAEVAAVLRHPYPQRGELYVARFVRSGRPALARPCATCQRVLIRLGVSKIWYTTDDGDWALMRLPRFDSSEDARHEARQRKLARAARSWLNT